MAGGIGREFVQRQAIGFRRARIDFDKIAAHRNSPARLLVEMAELVRVRSAICTPRQSRDTSRSWLEAIAASRAMKPSMKSSGVAASRAVWRATACTTASMFLER